MQKAFFQNEKFFAYTVLHKFQRPDRRFLVAVESSQDSRSGSDGIAIVSFTAATAITDYWNSSGSFCNAAPLLISDFFSAPLAKQKETRYNMTERTESVIFKEA